MNVVVVVLILVIVFVLFIAFRSKQRGDDEKAGKFSAFSHFVADKQSTAEAQKEDDVEFWTRNQAGKNRKFTSDK